MIPADSRYLESHEWAKKEGAHVVVGITDFAVKHLTDLVYMALPKVGDRLTKGQRFGEIESVKAVSDLVAPMSGEVVEVNEGLTTALDRIAADPFGDGWMLKLKPSDPGEWDQLLDPVAYQKVIETAD